MKDHRKIERSGILEANTAGISANKLHRLPLRSKLRRTMSEKGPVCEHYDWRHHPLAAEAIESI